MNKNEPPTDRVTHCGPLDVHDAASECANSATQTGITGASASSVGVDSGPLPSVSSGSASGPDDHDHDHAQSHEHSHSSATNSRTRLTLALLVTATVLVAELIGAVVSGSLSLAADAGHMLVDSAGLIIALIAAHLMTRPRDDRHTWGWARSEVIAAALQAGMLAVICLMVAFEAVTRLLEPTTLEPVPMLIIGIIGLVANALSLAILAGGRGESLNMRAAVLEVANDALGSVAVIAAALIAMATGWGGADAIASLFIAALMAPRAFALLRKSVRILMEETPESLDLELVRQHILALPEVRDIHDLHVTTIASGVISLTAHITVDEDATEHERRDLVHTLQDCVATHFAVPVDHSTFQIDSPEHRDHELLAH